MRTGSSPRLAKSLLAPKLRAASEPSAAFPAMITSAAASAPASVAFQDMRRLGMNA